MITISTFEHIFITALPKNYNIGAPYIYVYIHEIVNIKTLGIVFCRPGESK